MPSTATKAEWTILKTLQWTASYFDAHAIDSPRATSEILLAHALNLRRIDLYLYFDKPLTPTELATFKALIRRRIRREPVAYIIGAKEFWSLSFNVSPAVLIPRPETECLIETALPMLPPDPGLTPKRVLELGTGSGALIISLASERPGHKFFATDNSPQALGVAIENACKHSLLKKIHFFGSHWFQGLKTPPATFDLILSNPPYIASALLPTLQPEVSCYEPPNALDGDTDGMGAMKEIIAQAWQYLNPDGTLLLEIGHDQERAIANFANSVSHYQSAKCLLDYAGHDRVILLRKKDINSLPDGS